MFTQRTYVMKQEDAGKKWHLINAEGMVVGRVATEIATLLSGKHRPLFTPNADSGEFVVVINADKVIFTGSKWDDKVYHWHTNHVGGIKGRTAKEQLAKHPELILEEAVRGMLPKTTIGRKQITKLKIFTGAKHDHEAQKPVAYTVRK